MPETMTPREKVFVSASCEGERCHCGLPAVRKVGEENMHDDPNPRRHNLTAYVCARHFAEMMGPAGARSVGYTALASGSGDHAELARLAEAATPGKWRVRKPSRTVVLAIDEDGRTCGEVLRTVSGSLNSYREANAAFIAAANPATVLALIAEVAALRGENDLLDRENKKANAIVERYDRKRSQLTARATEAERKLAEAEEWIAKQDCECDPAWSSRQCSRCTFLSSKEAERG